MPTLVDLLNQNRNQRNGYWVYLNENPGGGEKESQTNKNAGEQKKIFKDQQSAFGPRRNLYGLAGTIFIESRGLVNPGRVAALLVSSPVPAADLIGGQVNGFLGGNSNRPDDTLFRNKLLLSKPITLPAVTQALLRDAVKADTNYYRKPYPFPGNILKNIIAAFSNPAAFVSMGVQAAQKFGSKKELKRLADMLKKKGDPGGYGPKFATKKRGESKTDAKEVVTYSQNYTLFKIGKSKTGTDQYSRVGGSDVLGGQGHAEIAKRENTAVLDGSSKFDYINDVVLSTPGKTINEGKDTQSEVLDYLKSIITGYTFVTIKLYGKKRAIVLPGVISGLSEDISPEINSFKYVGSPFSLYKYGGVERTIKFNLKLYALSPKHEVYLRTNLDFIRQLAYPDQDISAVKYASNDSYSPLFFSPNLIELGIYGLYKDVLGIVDGLSITIDDNTSWASNNFFDSDKVESKPHPTVFDISFGMKVIERPNIFEKDGAFKYEYGKSENTNRKYDNFFTGYNPNVNTGLTEAELQGSVGGTLDDFKSLLFGLAKAI